MSRLDPSSDYFSKQMRLYVKGFFESQRRELYKSTLQRLFESDAKTMSEHNLLKMYLLADQGRLSTFLHAEDRPHNVFSEIETLAGRYLGVSASYFRQGNEAVLEQESSCSKVLCD